MASTDFLETSVKYYCLKVQPNQVPSFNGVAGAAASSAPSPSKDGKKFQKNQKELFEMSRRRFFYRPAFEIYGGVAGFFTYGPPGCALKNNIINQWRRHFVIEENLLEVEDTCIMQHAVLKASGHVDRFNDFMVKDVIDESKFFRADKLLEEVMEAKLETAGITEEQRVEYTTVKNQADAFSKQELADVFRKYQIKSPESGNNLSDPYEFNLMFPTPIGPGGYLQGYMRPETAQGIFLNYKFCLEQNSNRLPFGVAQVGKAFRNEIAPRAGLTRQREFTQAEIEYFVNPKNKVHPKFKFVEDTELTLFHSDEQLAAKDPVRITIGEAVRRGMVNNETLGFMIVRTYQFLVSVGIDKDYVRFRQHLPTEMAHYACDCWDAEIFGSYGWLECVGIADRSAFDLTAHSEAAKCDLQYKEVLEKPIEQEVLAITKASGIQVMKEFKKEGKMVKEWIEGLSQPEMNKIQADVETRGSSTVTIGDKKFTLPGKILTFEKKVEKTTVNAFTPGVIEPSFGIDRIFSCVLEHVYYARPKDADSTDTQTRGVLAFTGISAPYKCTILPLDQRIARHEKYVQMLERFRAEASSIGISFTVDESGATIGRRYARNDELGIPYAITLDFDTLEDETVTMRERDTMEQIRLPMAEVVVLLRDLCTGEKSWKAAPKMETAPKKEAAPEKTAPPKKEAASKKEASPKKEGKDKKDKNKSAEQAAAPAEEDPEKARKDKLKKVIKEGGKRGIEIEGAADMGGLQFFCTAVEIPDGDEEMLVESMKAMNAKVDEKAEERKGGSGHIGKMIFSAGAEQLAVVAYVPEEKQSELSCAEWLKAVLDSQAGELMNAAPDISVGRVKTDADKGVFPLKIREPMILEANNFLRKKGLFPEDDSDDDEMVFGDDDFPS